MEVDRGAARFMTGTLGLARELDLPFEPVHELSVRGVNCVAGVPFPCHGLMHQGVRPRAAKGRIHGEARIKVPYPGRDL